MKTVVLCYGLLITWPVDHLGAWLQAHGARVVMEQPVPGALYVGHSAGAGRCAALAQANHGHSIGIDPVPSAGDRIISAAALGDDHLGVVNDPRTHAIIIQDLRGVPAWHWCQKQAHTGAEWQRCRGKTEYHR